MICPKIPSDWTDGIWEVASWYKTYNKVKECRQWIIDIMIIFNKVVSLANDGILSFFKVFYKIANSLAHLLWYRGFNLSGSPEYSLSRFLQTFPRDFPSILNSFRARTCPYFPRYLFGLHPIISDLKWEQVFELWWTCSLNIKISISN